MSGVHSLVVLELIPSDKAEAGLLCSDLQTVVDEGGEAFMQVLRRARIGGLDALLDEYASSFVGKKID